MDSLYTLAVTSSGDSQMKGDERDKVASLEDKLILGWFMKERKYRCLACGATLFSSFDEPNEIDCPDCGCVMGPGSPEPGVDEDCPLSERIYICGECGYETLSCGSIDSIDISPGT